MHRDIQQLYQELSDFELLVATKSRQLHDHIAELEQTCHDNVTEIEQLKQEKAALTSDLQQLQQQFTDLLQEHEHQTATLSTQGFDQAKQLFTPSAEYKVTPASPPPDDEPLAIEQQAEPTITHPVPDEALEKQKPAQQSFEFSHLLTLLLSILAPLQSVIARVSVLNNMYDQIVALFLHYKKQEKMAVFLMTVSGIMLLVIGFAYILQYSFVQLTIEWKLFCSFVVAAGVVLLGIKLHHNKSDMQEYAAALIGLGMILAYLCAYFMGTAFSLVSPWVSFVVLALLTATAYLLAHIFNTRIVALVSLVGGACLPLLGEGEAWLMLLYPGYLLLLNMSSIHLAHKIRWAALSYIAFMLSAAMFGYHFSQRVEIDTVFSMAFLSVVMHLFFYLYLTYSYKLLDTAEKTKAAILMTANLALFISIISQVIGGSTLGWCLIADALLLSAVFLMKHTAQDIKRNSMLILQAALFLALAMLLFWKNHSFVPLLWGVEALLLLYLGMIFQLVNVRYEAYILMLVALIRATSVSVLWIMNGLEGSLFSSAWWMLLSIGVCLQLVLMVQIRFDSTLTDLEITLMHIIRESISLWLVIVVITTSYLLSNHAYLLIALPLMMLLFYRSVRFQLPLTEKVAWLLWLLPLAQIMIAANEAGSFLFLTVSWVGKLAYIEVFALLWLTSTFYLRYYAASRWAKPATPLRTIFYLLIPICFLTGVWHNHPTWLPAVLWLSALLSFMLYLWKNIFALHLEQMLLTAIALLATLFAAFFANNLPIAPLVVCLCAGLAYFAIILSYFKAFHLRDQAHAYRPLFITAFYYAALCCLLLISHLFGSLAVGMLGLQLYIMAMLWVFPTFSPLRTQLGYWYLGVLAVPLLMVAIVMFQHESELATWLLWPSALLSLLVVHVKRRHFSVLRNFASSYNSKLVYSHLTLILVYTIATWAWYPTVFQAVWSVLLVLHATLMLFESLWPRFAVLLVVSSMVYLFTAIKILFFDLHDLSMIEKVVAFVLMGSLLLLAAYFFQRLKTHLKTSTLFMDREW